MTDKVVDNIVKAVRKALSEERDVQEQEKLVKAFITFMSRIDEELPQDFQASNLEKDMDDWEGVLKGELEKAGKIYFGSLEKHYWGEIGTGPEPFMDRRGYGPLGKPNPNFSPKHSNKPAQEIHGSSPGVRNGGAILRAFKNHFDVKALPGDFLSYFKMGQDGVYDLLEQYGLLYFTREDKGGVSFPWLGQGKTLNEKEADAVLNYLFAAHSGDWKKEFGDGQPKLSRVVAWHEDQGGKFLPWSGPGVGGQKPMPVATGKKPKPAVGQGESAPAPKTQEAPKPQTPQTTPAKEGTGAAVHTYDYLKTTKVKDLGGSNDAELHKDKDGKLWVVKAYGGDEDRVANELVANAIYQKLGANVPKAGLSSVNGKFAVAYPYVEGEQKDKSEIVANAALGNHYVADAYLANHDFIGLTGDNVLWNKEGNPIRIDQGGALTYRAQGQEKDLVTDAVPELESMLGDKGQGKGTVEVTPEQMQAQIKDLLQNLSEKDIESIVSSVPWGSKTRKDKTLEALKGRRKALATISKEKDLGDKRQAAGESAKTSPTVQSIQDKDLSEQLDALKGLIEERVAQEFSKSIKSKTTSVKIKKLRAFLVAQDNGMSKKDVDNLVARTVNAARKSLQDTEHDKKVNSLSAKYKGKTMDELKGEASKLVKQQVRAVKDLLKGKDEATVAERHLKAQEELAALNKVLQEEHNLSPKEAATLVRREKGKVTPANGPTKDAPEVAREFLKEELTRARDILQSQVVHVDGDPDDVLLEGADALDRWQGSSSAIKDTLAKLLDQALAGGVSAEDLRNVGEAVEEILRREEENPTKGNKYFNANVAKKALKRWQNIQRLIAKQKPLKEDVLVTRGETYNETVLGRDIEKLQVGESFVDIFPVSGSIADGGAKSFVGGQGTKAVVEVLIPRGSRVAYINAHHGKVSEANPLGDSLSFGGENEVILETGLVYKVVKKGITGIDTDDKNYRPGVPFIQLQAQPAGGNFKLLEQQVKARAKKIKQQRTKDKRKRTATSAKLKEIQAKNQAAGQDE